MEGRLSQRKTMHEKVRVIKSMLYVTTRERRDDGARE